MQSGYAGAQASDTKWRGPSQSSRQGATILIAAPPVGKGWRWEAHLDVDLVGGTYELFRRYYALLAARDRTGHEIAAVRGVLTSVPGMTRGRCHPHRRRGRLHY
jgi:hypothetical protein